MMNPDINVPSTDTTFVILFFLIYYKITQNKK